MAGSVNEQAQRDSCTGVATAFTIVSIVIVSLRLYTRTVVIRNIGKDDWAMVAALVLTIAYLAAIYVLRDNGMGISGARLALTQMENLIKTTLAIEIMYYVNVFCIKLSILFCYLRIAAEKSFERWVKITIYVLTVFVVICIICCLTQCVPLHKMWDLMGIVLGKCINTTAFFYFTSSFNIVTDLWILTLPIRTLLQIQRPNREKFALLVIFGLGIFSCIASIVRLHAIRIYTQSTDPFYDSVPINLWSMVEVNIGIWCASIPSLKALISRGQRERSSRAAGYKYHSRDKSGTTLKGSVTKRGNMMRKQSTGTMDGATLNAQESFDLKSMDTSKDVVLTRPEVARHGKGTETSSGSDDNIFFPGSWNKV